MSQTQQESKTRTNSAPLWLPRDDAIVVDQSAARPPDFVEGYTRWTRLLTVALGSRWKIITVAATTLATLLFLATLPSLVDAGVGQLMKIVIYQTWTLGLMLWATMRFRSVSIGMVARYWLAGFFVVAVLAHFLHDIVVAAIESGEVWLWPLAEALLLSLPLIAAVILGRRAWRHPGLCDLMTLGFAVGGGYAFHQTALSRGATSGFEANVGLVVPSVLQLPGLFVVGSAVGASLLGLAIGLLVLHRHQAMPAAAAGLLLTVVIGDQMALSNGDGTLDWVRQLLFGGQLVALIFLAAVGGAVWLDHRRLASVGPRDHLFPRDPSPAPAAAVDDDLFDSVLIARYRRLRNGMHNTIASTPQQWPPRSEAHPAPTAALARLGRAAQVAVGPGASSDGWTVDPVEPAGFRFVGRDGYTAYAARTDVVEPTVETLDDPDANDSVATTATNPGVPTCTTLITEAPAEHRTALSVRSRDNDYWQLFGLSAVAVALYCLVRLLTAGDPSTEVFSLALDAPTPAGVWIPRLGWLGAAAAALSLHGTSPPVVGPGSDVGPGRDPSPHRPNECEA